MMKKTAVSLCLLLVIWLPTLGSQTIEHVDDHAIHANRQNDGHTTHPHFRVAAMIGHTLIPEEHAEKSFFVPSWGLDIEYWFDRRWAIGLHNDLEIETFVILRGEEEDRLERVSPLVVTLDALYRPWAGLVIQLGPGIEFEKDENFMVIRTGLEYEFEMGSHWDIAPVVFYDTRLSEYHTWTVALGVGKRF